MNGKIKYLAILILALLVSATTSYVTTSMYLSSLPAAPSSAAPTMNDLSPQVLQQLSQDIVEASKSNASLPFTVQFFAGGDSIVETHSQIALENLTIVYQYTRLSDNSNVTTSVDYGTFIPAWGAGAVIEAGASPEALYKIPESILSECSTKVTNSNGCLVFDGAPQLQVLAVYGYD
jgi:hypothetical protein